MSIPFQLLFPFIFCSTFIVQALVPPSATFIYVNDGEFGYSTVEYNANYRELDLSNDPFQLCFYNTTPNAYTLALRMGALRSSSRMRWVWEANRGKPVRENATLALGADGNLVLADTDGRTVWHTDTANKGVVGFKILPNGNMVLYDSKNSFIWQSFDYPTDTILVGQSLKQGGRLVSRVSEVENVDGPYSLVLENTTMSMYYKSPNSPKLLRYFSFIEWIEVAKGPIRFLTFNDDLAFLFEGYNSSYTGNINLSKARYNSTYSYLRLGVDGNVKYHTYQFEAFYMAWQVTYTLFSRDWDVSECQLPSRCGDFGVCEDNQCVACPKPGGLSGWSKDCKPPALTSCESKGFTYYKIEGVDHFLSKYTRGDGTSQEICSRKCSRDCKCLGYFYNVDSSRCWIVYDHKTLTKVSNSTHLGFIKTPSSN